MRIAVIAHALRGSGGISVGTNLISSLQHVRKGNEYLLTMPVGVGYEAVTCLPSTKKIYYDRKGGTLGRWCFDTFQLPKIISDFHPDILLCLGNRGVRYDCCPVVILCHDSHLFYPEKHYSNETWFNKAVKRYNKWTLVRESRRAALMLFQTETAAARARTSLGYTGPAAICPNAVSQAIENTSGKTEMPQALLPFKDKYKLFCLTRYYPHKNLEIIPEMFSRFRDGLANTVVILTISAGQHHLAARLLMDIKRRGLEDCIVNVGPLPQTELASYYQNCDALFLPTLLESFSGTYLEAMRFGKPILTSDLDFAHDVCGDAAIYFDPWDANSVKSEIMRFHGDGKLREQLAESGKKRLSSLFRSWDEIALELAEHIETLVQSK
ncbi:MAG: glycosyltransferase [Victivallales bacterium]